MVFDNFNVITQHPSSERGNSEGFFLMWTVFQILPTYITMCSDLYIFGKVNLVDCHFIILFATCS